ncbi:MAG: metal-dependent transcriptional regulator [Candidatus Bathyarchaeia archaeon]
MPRKGLQSTVEEYVQTIYRLEERNGMARTKNLAKNLGVKLGTITNTIERLEEKGLVTHEPYKGVRLTADGQKIAIEVIKKHRLSERLLTDLLNLDWSKVHETACRLEHVIDEELVKKLEKALKNPKTCPHGNPIPKGFGKASEDGLIPLKSLDLGIKGTIGKVTNESKEFLKYLDSMNLKLGSLIEVKEKNDNSLLIKSYETTFRLNKDIASEIWVKPEKGRN